MKSYTDLEQSKKLAEILPIESADMCFNTFNTRKSMPPLMTPYSRFNEFFDMEPTPAFLIPCWSLAALLSVLQEVDDNIEFWNDHEDWHLDAANYDVYSSSLVDACYEMIVKLKENNLL